MDVNKKKILIVEDEEAVRSMIVETLEYFDFIAIGVDSAVKALDLLKTDDLKDISLVVTDVMMPNMSGPEFVRELLNIYPETRILFMSGYTSESIESDDPFGDNVAFIQKPFRSSVLIERIKEMLAI
jgi:two-component system, cell cycle sensor histidine kinase and response regulator CckA